MRRPSQTAPPFEPPVAFVSLSSEATGTAGTVMLLASSATTPAATVSAATENAIRSVAIGWLRSSRSSQVIVHAPLGNGASTSTVKVTSSSASCGMPVLCGCAGTPQPTATVNDSSASTGCWKAKVMNAGEVPSVAPSDGLEAARSFEPLWADAGAAGDTRRSATTATAPRRRAITAGRSDRRPPTGGVSTPASPTRQR
ncbi:MAG: hypothetical protein ACPG7T_00775 [Ilumatobacteraceae bacterium]